MTDSFDAVVVGGGPGGLAAAAAAAESGLRVCVVDDNPAMGGQIWRSGIVSKRSGAVAQRTFARFENTSCATYSGWRVIGVSPQNGCEHASLRIEKNGNYIDLEYASLIVATGARELFLPFPGWTFPGVYGAGGLQAFVKSGFDISGKRIVVAGTGPLLMAVASGLRGAGAKIVSIVEQAPMARLLRFASGMLHGHVRKLVEGAGYAGSILGTPYRTGSWVTKVSGQERVEMVTIRSGSRQVEVRADMLAMGFHLVPNIELAQLLGCKIEQGYVQVNELQHTSVEGVYCVGEATGIGGVEKALVEGEIAGLAAAGKLERARSFFAARRRQMHFVPGLSNAFALRNELRTLATDDTVVCRCEDVSYGAVSACRDWREAKLHTRCGMGPCQGRICNSAAQFLFGWEAAAPRPPLFPVDVATLAEVSGTTVKQG